MGSVHHQNLASRILVIDQTGYRAQTQILAPSDKIDSFTPQGKIQGGFSTTGWG